MNYSVAIAMTSSDHQFVSSSTTSASSSSSSATTSIGDPLCQNSNTLSSSNISQTAQSRSSTSGSNQKSPSTSRRMQSRVSQAKSTPPPECAGCHKPILERFLLKALDRVWHEDCLKCSCCNCRLGEIGSTLFTKADLILCKRDYLRMFGATGFCSSCQKQIPAFEMVMRARGNVYHLECFKCEACSHRFCVGDRFYLQDSKILCEYDYEEQIACLAQQQQQQRNFFSQGPPPLSMENGIPPQHPEAHHFNSGPSPQHPSQYGPLLNGNSPKTNVPMDVVELKPPKMSLHYNGNGPNLGPNPQSIAMTGPYP